MILGLGVLERLSTQGCARIHTAYRPKTVKAQIGHFTTFLQFLEYVGLSLDEVHHVIVIAFIELLVANGLKIVTISNYLSSIKNKYKLYGLSVSSLEHEWVQRVLRSIELNVPVQRQLKCVFSLQQLQQIVEICDTIPLGWIYKVVFLVAYFAFLRLSNLVPTSISGFDPTRHLCRGDWIVSDDSVGIMLKWSKTLQFQSSFKVIPLPCLGNSPLCPVKAFEIMTQYAPLPSQAPMFSIPQGCGSVPLTQSKVRKMLHSILLGLGMDSAGLSFHAFRRSGASLAFQNEIPIQDIKMHGTWESDTEWKYVIQEGQTRDGVSTRFEQLLKE